MSNVYTVLHYLIDRSTVHDEATQVALHDTVLAQELGYDSYESLQEERARQAISQDPQVAAALKAQSEAMLAQVKEDQGRIIEMLNRLNAASEAKAAEAKAAADPAAENPAATGPANPFPPPASSAPAAPSVAEPPAEPAPSEPEPPAVGGGSGADLVELGPPAPPQVADSARQAAPALPVVPAVPIESAAQRADRLRAELAQAEAEASGQQ